MSVLVRMPSETDAFQVLRQFRPFFSTVTIYNPKEFRGNSRRTRIRRLGQCFGFSVLVVSLLGVNVSAFLFCAAHDFTLSQIAGALSIFLGGTQMFGIYVTISLKSRQISSILQRLNVIIRKRCVGSTESQATYENVENRHAFITSMLIKASYAGPISAFGVMAMCPISYAYYGTPQPKHWLLPLAFRSPFLDEPIDSYWRFYTDWTMQTLSSIMYYTVLLISAIFYIGMCLYINAMVVDLNSRMKAIDSDVFLGQISLHNDILGVADSVREIISPVLFYQLLLCATNMSVFLFASSGESEMTGSQPIISFMAITSMTCSTFIYCYLSENVTADLYAIGDAFYRCAWYELAIGQQKLFVLPIQRTHHEFRLSGFGIIDCSLAVFVSIMRASFSYFLMMRKNT